MGVIMFFLIQSILNSDPDTYVPASALFVTALIFLFNNIGRMGLARGLFYIFYSVVIFAISYIYGEGLSAEISYSVFLVAGLLFYENNWIRLFVISLIIFLFFASNYVYENYESPLDEYVYPFDKVIMFVISVFCGAIMLITYFNETRKQYRIQEKLSLQLKKQNKELKVLIEEKKEANDQLLAKQEELEKKNQHLTQFAFIASHDLKTPIRGISSFVDLLKKKLQKNEKEEVHEYLAFIKNGTTKMYRQIEAVLETSEYLNIQLDYEEVDLSEIFKNLEPLFVPPIQNDKRNELIFPQHLPLIVAHKNSIEKLFQNLIENGLKYNQSSRPRVQVTYHSLANKHQFLVKDNGIGIPTVYHQQVFEIFKRLHKESEFTGSGVGLAICKQIVELHHGNIWIEEPLPDSIGTTFGFTIPKSL